MFRLRDDCSLRAWHVTFLTRVLFGAGVTDMQVRQWCFGHPRSRHATLAGLVLLCLLVPALGGCASFGVSNGAEVGYSPPFIPVTFSFGTDGAISVSAGVSITTPIGTFSVGDKISVPIANGSTRLSIIHSVSGSEVKDVYDIAETGPMTICLDGRFLETVGARETTITALNSVSSIRIVQDGSQCPGGEPPSPVSLARSSSQSPSPVGQAPSAIQGVWAGTYTCAQGLTGLQLTIRDTGGGTLAAIFSFYAVSSNPGVPSGSYAMTGTYSATGIVLHQDYWINQPSGYEMVDLESPPPSGNTLHGTVAGGGSSCTTFSVTNDAAVPPLPEIQGVWTGTYTCAQGLTGLRLTIRDTGSGTLSATFSFYAVSSNPGVPSGSYTMTGTYSATGIVLHQDAWINQPPGYSMVDLVAPPPSGNTMQGSVVTCDSFSVSR